MKKQTSEPVKTMLTISMGFLLIFIVTKAKWALPASLFIGLIGMFSTWLSAKIDFLWMKLSRFLGLIVPNIILTIVFYAFLFPIALITKLFGNKDKLMLKNKYNSTFTDRNKSFNKESMKHPW